MNVRNLLADAFTSAATRLRNNSCGMSDQEMETALHKMLYLLDNDHHFNEADARAAIARMYYFRNGTLCSVYYSSFHIVYSLMLNLEQRK